MNTKEIKDLVKLIDSLDINEEEWSDNKLEYLRKYNL